MTMHVYRKGLIAGFLSALLLLGSYQVSSAAAVSPMRALISFTYPGVLAKHSDILFGLVRPEPQDRIILNPDGKTTLIGKGTLVAPYGGSAGRIVIRNTDNQDFNLWLSRLQTGPGIARMTPLCAFNGGDEIMCSKMPPTATSFKRPKTLNLGMGLLVSDATDNNSLSLFDIGVVYQ